jgi:tRNA modification GTPase
MNSPDTIYAVSSGSGMAGIAVIRLSGSKVSRLVVDIARSLPRPRRASVRQLLEPVSKDILDEAIVLWMPGPNSATGEDIAEFHVHGSVSVIQALFAVFENYEGVRLAEAGEFTGRLASCTHRGAAAYGYEPPAWSCQFGL